MIKKYDRQNRVRASASRCATVAAGEVASFVRSDRDKSAPELIKSTSRLDSFNRPLKLHRYRSNDSEWIAKIVSRCG